MCMFKRPKIDTTSPGAAPAPPQAAAQVVEAGAGEDRDGVLAKKRGRSALRIDLGGTSGGTGLNIPG